MTGDFVEKLMIDVPPNLKRGQLFLFEVETGRVYGVENGNAMEHPLRSGYSQYLWLLKLFNNKYLKDVKQ